MQQLPRFFLLTFFVLAFAKCTPDMTKLVGSSIRSIERNTIVTQNKKSPLAFYDQTDATMIYLIRHAEKESTEGKDPGLTEEGIQRSQRLAKIFKGTTIDAIFSTPYQRTRQTVHPTAQFKDLKVEEYDPNQLTAFAERLNRMKGKRMLVSGHSNTTPALMNLLVSNEVYKQIDESNYNHFYIVCLSSNGVVKHVMLNY